MIEGYDKPFGYVHTSLIHKLPWPSFWSLDHEQRILTLSSCPHSQERTKLMNTMLRTKHEKANESFPVYSSESGHVLDVDGCGADVFGIVDFSVHQLAYANTKHAQILGS